MAIEFIRDKGQIKRSCAKIRREESVGTVVWEEGVHTKPLLKARFGGRGLCPMSWEATGSLEPRGEEARGRQAREGPPEVRVRVWPGRG